MMMKDLHVNIWDLIFPLARAVDMMSPALAQHHLRVAYLAMRISEELDIEPLERRDIVAAGALHDIGAFSLNERLDLLAFEDEKTEQHCKAGYLLLKSFPMFADMASMVRFHHVPWRNGAGAREGDLLVPRGAQILYLADRISVLVDPTRPVLGQAHHIRESMRADNGRRFVPEYTEAFLRIASSDYVWIETVSDGIASIIEPYIAIQNQDVDSDGLLKFAHLLCRVIDFKSEFTAAHSTGVAATASALGRWIGFSPHECRMLEIAAFLHDLGKLAVPSEIIEKPDRLTTDEWQIMRTHVYYTYSILESIDALSVITSWSALHQERLNGTGYPFHFNADQLPLGARIVAVADVFTAVTEDRPYRAGSDKEAALGLLATMAGNYEIDPGIVAILEGHFDEANGIRAAAQRAAVREYGLFKAALN